VQEIKARKLVEALEPIKPVALLKEYAAWYSVLTKL